MQNDDECPKNFQQLCKVSFESIEKEILHTREFLESRVSSFNEKIEEHLAHHRQIFEEKFSAIEMRFNERDIRFRQLNEDNITAINSTISFLKSANEKLETTFSKQIDSLSTKADTLANRIVELEGQRHGSSTTIGWSIAIASVIIGIVSALGSFIHSLFDKLGKISP